MKYNEVKNKLEVVGGYDRFMKAKQNVLIAILTILIALMEITGIPSVFFVHVEIADIEPYYFTMMMNFIIIGIISFVYLKKLCPQWKLGFTKVGLVNGLKKYGVIGIVVAFIGFVAFYIGLRPFDKHPSIIKVLVEGVIYYIGVAIVEELYIRGLLLNLIEKIFYNNKNQTLIAVVLSSVIFGLGHILEVMNQPMIIIVSKVIWMIGMGIFLGTVYKKSNNIWIPIIIHFFINVCALPYCFSSFNGYADITLYIVVPMYIVLSGYSLFTIKCK